MQKLELKGSKIGRWTVIDISESRNKHGQIMWDCICECGNKSSVTGAALKGGKSNSCGCINREITAAKNKERLSSHGMSHTPVWNCWMSIKQRCNNPKNKRYSSYGGRGITLCERWNSFENFYSDMGDRPTELHSLDRIDNDKGYSPDNCRWATKKQQSRNTSKNRIVEIDGVSKTIAEWSEIYGHKGTNLYYRIRTGWDVKEAITTPTRAINRK